jgi:signal transduction histidine kinase
LAIVAAIVTAHHGRVTVTAPPEGGTVFTVVLPQAVDGVEVSGPA